MPSPRIAAALSGGADSAIAACRLLDAGAEVLGLFGRFVAAGPGAEHWAEAEAAARAVCQALGIELHVVDLTDEFRRRVIDYFVKGYAAGETPNPCLVCNAAVKFGLLLTEARRLACEVLATGHYALRQRHGQRWGLRRARDLAKDQSYMLMGLSQDQLAAARFPLGDALKSEVVAEAKRRGLPVIFRESQDICFLREPYGDFVARFVEPQPGPILDLDGRQIGRHRGLIYYTVGQRRGLNVSGGRRLYVVAKDPARNALILGPREALARRRFFVRQVNWVSIDPPQPGQVLNCWVMVRYRGRLIEAAVTPLQEGLVQVDVQPHDQAIAPGQGAAFYDADGWLLGGGFISAALEGDSAPSV